MDSDVSTGATTDGSGADDNSRGPASTVLVVDDHRLFAEVLAMRLRDDRDVARVETAHALGPARALLNVVGPDVVVLDYHVGDELGLALLPDLVAMDRPPRVLVVSGSTDPAAVVDALEAGADGWLGKDSGIDVLMQALATVLAGDVFLPPGALRPVLRQLLHEARGVPRDGSFVELLSPRETEVLRCLVAGLTRAETAQRLFVSKNTVRTHVQNLLKHADLHSTGALVAAARELGVPGIDEPSRGAPPAPPGSSA